ncbi:hypothetical protein [Ekhidna sp.]|uniref:hypothetical protein n=1 Tax=Ekhidna sp. TaxID=2608089 RepID=UPI003BAC90A5
MKALLSQSETHRLNEMIADAVIEFDGDYKKGESAIQFEVNDEQVIFGTFGNFSVITGKAKSRKSFFITYLVKESISAGHKVLVFDTEQASYKVHENLLRATGNIPNDQVEYYALRKFNPSERKEIVEKLIYESDMNIVFIDGIRDLVNSINDEEEATNISSCLLKWTEEKNIHIVTVLHQNKGDNFARGHIGTELQNKAETVVSISKDDRDKDQSVVEPVHMREMEFDPFSLNVSHTGIPGLTEYIQTSTEKKKKRPEQFDIAERKEIILMVKEVAKEWSSYSDLWRQIKEACGRWGIVIGDNIAKDWLSAMKQDQFIEKSNSKYYITV